MVITYMSFIANPTNPPHIGPSLLYSLLKVFARFPYAYSANGLFLTLHFFLVNNLGANVHL